MGQRLCTACGRSVDIDDHHIAGAAYDDATADVCALGCHGFLTRRQMDNGVNLSRTGPKSDVDSARARALGLNDLLSLSVRRRQPEMVPVAAAFDSCTGIASALLDLTDDPDRPGRWLPDTIGARHRSPWRIQPMPLIEGVEIPVVEQLVGAVAALGESLLLEEQELAALLRLASDAQPLYEKLERFLSDDPEVQAAWAEVPVQMEEFAHHFEEYLVAVFTAVSADSVENIPELEAMGRSLAPVFRSMMTFFADAEAASTAEEHRALLLRLPEALNVAL
jgi:hypothetical protein